VPWRKKDDLVKHLIVAPAASLEMAQILSVPQLMIFYNKNCKMVEKKFSRHSCKNQ